MLHMFQKQLSDTLKVARETLITDKPVEKLETDEEGNSPMPKTNFWHGGAVGRDICKKRELKKVELIYDANDMELIDFMVEDDIDIAKMKRTVG
jgi:hypothetical protein